jgi:branched-chain amino acid transport system permease protein
MKNAMKPTFLIISILCLAAVVLACAQYANSYVLQVGTSLAMYAVLCLAWNIVGGYMGYPSFATATLFGLGCYAGAIAQTQGIPMGVAWIIAAAVGALFAWLIGAVLLGLRGHYFAIGSIATVEVMREIANNWDGLTGGAIGLNVPILAGSPEFIGKFFYLAMWAFVLVALAVTVIVDKTRFGFGLRCIRQNERAATMVGVDVFKYKVGAFVLSGVLAASVGAVYASMVSFVEPKDAFNLFISIEVPVMVMLGCGGTIAGPVIGAVIFIILKEFVWSNFINFHSAILGVIVIIVIYFLPEGVLGAMRRRLFSGRGRSQTSLKKN